MTVVAILGVAIVCGLIANLVKLPPMLGFLLAGFLLQAAVTGILPFPTDQFDFAAAYPAIKSLADTGVTLLLFTIGLKLDLRSLLRPEVLGTACAHMGISSILWAAVFWLLSFTGLSLFAGTSWGVYLILGFALAFSSTIFVVKTLDDQAELEARFGVVAIGVLIIQDLAAAVFISQAKGTLPSIWALGLLLLLPASWLLKKIISAVGRNELLIVLGVFLALGGYQLFEAVHLKGDLGAIVMGALVAGHPRAKLLANRLFSLRELLLVGFFLSIGQYGLPGLESMLVAVVLLAVLPMQTLVYMVLFRMTRLRVRTAAKAALLLTNYSEFGLIAGVVAVNNNWISQTWMVALALAVTISFIASTVVNHYRLPLVNLLSSLLQDLPDEQLIPLERPISFEGIKAVVFGMGEVGYGAYQRLIGHYGQHVRGIDMNPKRVKFLRKAGINVMEGDCTESSLWERMHKIHAVELVVLAMPDHDGNYQAYQQIQQSGVDALVAVAARDAEQFSEFNNYGADVVLDLLAGAGAELGELALKSLGESSQAELEVVTGASKIKSSSAGAENTENLVEA